MTTVKAMPMSFDWACDAPYNPNVDGPDLSCLKHVGGWFLKPDIEDCD